eukprot:TRINITY_DN41475_c0_g2_i1.p1 TRINITY_DN41475_c0_g2~~TRINITY_DN41475_c0_g2_i1.p1  ORF type:complete len:637 (+),score=127.27 TRINITY_DN41475_c0_g2_i1:72-1982(+)
MAAAFDDEATLPMGGGGAAMDDGLLGLLGDGPGSDAAFAPPADTTMAAAAPTGTTAVAEAAVAAAAPAAAAEAETDAEPDAANSAASAAAAGTTTGAPPAGIPVGEPVAAAVAAPSPPPTHTLPAGTAAFAPPADTKPRFKRSATEALDITPTAEDAPSAAGGVTADTALATLASTNPATAADIHLGDSAVKVGRDCGKDVAGEVALEDPRVSAVQFVIRKAASGAGGFELEDLSTNGTLVNKKLIKASVVAVKSNDLIEVLPAAKVGRAASIAFLFQGKDDDGAVVEPAAKRMRSADASGTDKLFASVMCAICQEVMHKAASVQPCLHSFCSSCLSGWLARPAFGKAPMTCPLCRKAVTGVSLNHTVNDIVESLLAANPDRQRPDALLKELDSTDSLAKAGYDLAKLSGSGGKGLGKGGGPAIAAFMGFPALFGLAGAAGDDDEDEDGSESAASDDSDGSPPAPAGPPSNCFHCGVVMFGARTLRYYASHFAAPPRIPGLLEKTFARNTFESGLLTEWLESVRHQSLEEAVAALLETPNPAGAAALRLNFERPADPSQPPLAEAGWSNLHACGSCGSSMICALAYALRERMPEAEMPARGRGRGNCWYGRSCRTQSHKPEHASRLNHVCPQTRFH